MKSTWEEYISKITKQEKYIKYLEQGNKIPAIVHVSVEIINKMQRQLGINNICVFPTVNSRYPFYYLLSYLLKTVDEVEKAEPSYEEKYEAYSSLNKGDKIAIGRKIVEFDSIDTTNGKLFVTLKCSDLNCKLPFNNLPSRIEFAPISCKPTNYDSLVEEMKLLKSNLPTMTKTYLTPHEDEFHTFQIRKSYLQGSIVYISSISDTKTHITEYSLFHKPISKVVNFGKISPLGEIQNIYYTSIKTNPDILLASDLYSVLLAHENNIPIDSIIIDITTIKNITESIDVIDDIIRLNIPITIVTNTKNSLNLDEFMKRDFHLWRWLKWLLTADIGGAEWKTTDKLPFYFKKTFSFVKTNDIDIDELHNIFKTNKTQLLENEQLVEPFHNLQKIFSYVIRSIYNVDYEERVKLITESISMLDNIKDESRFISEETLKLFEDITLKLISLLSDVKRNSKISTLQKLYKKEKLDSLYVVVPTNVNKANAKNYIISVLPDMDPFFNIYIYYPEEYINAKSAVFATTIIVGWFNRDTMFDIFDANVTFRTYILLYQHEYEWAQNALRYWKKQFHIDNMENVMDTIFPNIEFYKFESTRNMRMICEEGNKHRIDQDNTDTTSEPEPVDSTTNKVIAKSYQKKTTKHGKVDLSSDIDSFIDLAPLNINELKIQDSNQHSKKSYSPKDFTTLFFSDGTKGTYVNSHKLIVVTEIFTKDDGQIYLVPSSDIAINDYIIEREKDKDLLHELALKILSISNLEEIEQTANIWKQKLQELPYTEEEIFEKLKENGCEKNRLTVHNWISNPLMITPKSINDLKHIAKIIDDKNFDNQINEIFDAGKIIKNAHKQAGRYLTKLLKKKLTDRAITIDNYLNTTELEPIEIDNIGIIKILEVQDIIKSQSK